MSVFEIDRIASRSLRSSRPMRSSLVDIALTPDSDCSRRIDCWKHVRAHEPPRVGVDRWVETVGRVERVTEDDAHHPFSGTGRVNLRDEASEMRCREASRLAEEEV